MAGMGAGTGALTSLLGKLTALLGDEHTLLAGVRKEAEFLQRELGAMQGLLETLADKPRLDPQEKLLKGNVRELTYAIEDCVDRFVLRLGSSGGGDADGGFIKDTVRRLKTLRRRHELATQFKDLKALVMEESQRRERYRLDNRGQSSSGSVVELDPRLPALYAEAKGLVAIDGPRDRVVSWLAEKSVDLKVVAIVGGGGLGKTTLAMEAYRNITGSFECRASVSVSRTLDLDKLLKDVLSQVDEDVFRKCQKDRWENEQLIRQTRKFFTGKRYLIVIDDVWKEEDWKFVEAAFPDNHNGSRIIVTTRITSVANSCCSNSGDHLYKMAALNDVDSRRLFFKRIFQSENSCPPHLEKVSVKIFKKCGGLPLAIITIASLLANKPQNTGEWDKLQDSIGTGLSYETADGGKGMRDILLLSYWDLPHHLKTCLLYLCIYPEDHHINCAELKSKWIAEGFVATQWGNLYQEAENYFNGLVNRNMIQPVDVGYDGIVHYCQVHDMVLDLIISLTEEENFALVLNGRVCNSLPSKIRRLSMQSSGQEHKGAIHEITKSKLHLRSLNVFGEAKQIPPLVDFHSLRVLDLFDGNIWWENKHIKNIGSLSQLRYLRLNGTEITKLPEEIGKLHYLETLDLCGCDNLTTLPSTMVRLQKLVRLFIPNNLWLPEDVLGSMQALEELSDIYRIDNPVKFAEELGHLTKLRKLSLSCQPPLGQGHDPMQRFLELMRTSITKLVKYNLRYLHTADMLGNYLFWDPSHTFPHLQVIKVSGSMSRVPSGMASLNDVVNLNIELVRIHLEELHILMGMPSLIHLQLTVLNCGPGAKKAMTVGSNGFKLLKGFCFTFMGFTGTGIAFAPGAMPALRRLHLHWKAKDVMCKRSYSDSADMGIEHLSGLEHLQVETDCLEATVGEVEAVEGSIEKAIAVHPNRYSLQVHISRKYYGGIFKDDKERAAESNTLPKSILKWYKDRAE